MPKSSRKLTFEEVNALSAPNAHPRTLAPSVLLLVALSLVGVGCLPVDTSRPTCFSGDGCLPTVDVTFSASACLGANESACRDGLDARISAASDVVLCLAVADRAGIVDQTGGALGTVPTALALVPGEIVSASLFWLAGAECDAQWRPDAECAGQEGCLFALRAGEARVPTRGAFNVDFGLRGCVPEWGSDAPVEICDDADQDCDGEIDESLGVGDECTEGMCQGVTRCDDAGTAVCALAASA